MMKKIFTAGQFRMKIPVTVGFLTATLSQTSLGRCQLPSAHEYVTDIGGMRFGLLGYYGEDVSFVYYGPGRLTLPLPFWTVVTGASIIPLFGMIGSGFAFRRRQAAI